MKMGDIMKIKPASDAPHKPSRIGMTDATQISLDAVDHVGKNDVVPKFSPMFRVFSPDGAQEIPMLIYRCDGKVGISFSTGHSQAIWLRGEVSKEADEAYASYRVNV